MKNKSAIYYIHNRTFLRNGFILFMSLYISVGHFHQNSDCLEVDNIELAEEGGLDTEKKEGTEEIEKDEFLNKLFFCNFLNQQKLHTLHNPFRIWNISSGDVPTPPPKTFLV